jgi:hypothetical protein
MMLRYQLVSLTDPAPDTREIVPPEPAHVKCTLASTPTYRLFGVRARVQKIRYEPTASVSLPKPQSGESGQSFSSRPSCCWRASPSSS